MRKTKLGLVILIGCLACTGLAFASEETADHLSPYLLASSHVAPEYPPAALAARFEGTVTVFAEVRSDGTVGEIDVLDSTHPKLGFEDAAVEAVGKWRFHPAMQEGEPVGSWAIYRVNFRADGSRLDPSSYVYSGQVQSVLAAPGIGAGRSRPIVDPDDIAAAAAHENIPRMQRVKLPPCRNGGGKCMYDKTDLVPAPRRVMGR